MMLPLTMNATIYLWAYRWAWSRTIATLSVSGSSLRGSESPVFGRAILD